MEFYKIISQKGGGEGGSTGFHISYSEIVITPKSVGKSGWGFHKSTLLFSAGIKKNIHNSHAIGSSLRSFGKIFYSSYCKCKFDFIRNQHSSLYSSAYKPWLYPNKIGYTVYVNHGCMRTITGCKSQLHANQTIVSNINIFMKWIFILMQGTQWYKINSIVLALSMCKIR